MSGGSTGKHGDDSNPAVSTWLVGCVAIQSAVLADATRVAKVPPIAANSTPAAPAPNSQWRHPDALRHLMGRS